MSAPRFTADDVATLLREARAREPWQAVERCKDAANFLNAAAGLLPAMMPADNDLDAAYRQARATAVKLRKELHKLVGTHLAAAVAPVPSGPWSGEVQRQQEVYRAKALRFTTIVEQLDIEFPEEQPPKSKFMLFFQSWTAAALLHQYSVIVGSGTQSKNGPAARFIAGAMTKVGFTVTGGRGAVTPASVEDALRRLYARLTANRCQ